MGVTATVGLIPLQSGWRHSMLLSQPDGYYVCHHCWYHCVMSSLMYVCHQCSLVGIVTPSIAQTLVYCHAQHCTEAGVLSLPALHSCWYCHAQHCTDAGVLSRPALHSCWSIVTPSIAQLLVSLSTSFLIPVYCWPCTSPTVRCRCLWHGYGDKSAQGLYENQGQHGYLV